MSKIFAIAPALVILFVAVVVSSARVDAQCSVACDAAKAWGEGGNGQPGNGIVRLYKDDFARLGRAHLPIGGCKKVAALTTTSAPCSLGVTMCPFVPQTVMELDPNSMRGCGTPVTHPLTWCDPDC